MHFIRLLLGFCTAMAKGIYQLLIKLDRDETIRVGRLGVFTFAAGYYVYTGSAMSGIEQRVGRHLSKSKKLRWHIDFLLERSSIMRYASKETSADVECAANAETMAMPGALVPVKGFGSSDCRCPAHLVYFEDLPPRLPVETQCGGKV